MSVAIQVAFCLGIMAYGLLGILKKEIHFGLRGSVGVSIKFTGVPARIDATCLILSGIAGLIPVLFYDFLGGIFGDRNTANSVGMSASLALVFAGFFLSIVFHVALGLGETIRKYNQDNTK